MNSFMTGKNVFFFFFILIHFQCCYPKNLWFSHCNGKSQSEYCSFDWIFFCYCWKVLISRLFINPLIERVSHHTAQWKSNLKSSWERSIFQLIWKFYVCHVFDWIFFEVFVRLIRTYQQLVNELKFSSNYFPLWSRF